MRKNKRTTLNTIIVIFIMLLYFLGGAIKHDNDHLIKKAKKDFKQDAYTEANSYLKALEYLKEQDFNGAAYMVVNNSVPFFENNYENEFEEYSELDELGRCGAAFAMISPNTLPTEERESISEIKPTGWQTFNTLNKLNQRLIDGTQYVYNRCHLIAFSLAGENANPENLITGTRYMNINMTDFENEVLNYVKETGKKVLYRVTPIFRDEELVCRGVLMEALSIEDSKICFCAYLFNAQYLENGILLNIDYKTGNIN